MTERRRFLRHSALSVGSLLVPGLRPTPEPSALGWSDRPWLVGVHINPEMRVKLARGPARAELVHHGWRSFLVQVHNEAGTTAVLRATAAGDWLDVEMLDGSPLSGRELEYRIVRLYSRDAGLREATLAFDVGQGTQDLGFRNELPVLFDCRPALSR